MFTSSYAIENIAKAHIKDEIDHAARDHMASQTRARKRQSDLRRQGPSSG